MQAKNKLKEADVSDASDAELFERKRNIRSIEVTDGVFEEFDFARVRKISNMAGSTSKRERKSKTTPSSPKR